MQDAAEIQKAITAHGTWTARLKTAIETGVLDAQIVMICQDDQCTFGKWLHGATLTSEDRATSHYKCVTELHTQFHKAAGRVAELVLLGDKSGAASQMAPGSAFANRSAELARALLAWSDSLRKAA